MDREKITTRVVETIVERLELSKKVQVVPEMRFIEDLKADSLTRMELVLAFEDTFDIRANDEESEKLLTVKDAIDFVCAHVSKGA